MRLAYTYIVGIVSLLNIVVTAAFSLNSSINSRSSCPAISAISQPAEGGDAKSEGKEDNKAMAFLRKIGKVGGAANQDFANAVGVDEGTAGKMGQSMAVRKSKSAYQSCVVSGTIDNLSETFPFTSSGTQWSGVTDTVMGGVSSGTLTREEYEGRTANVLRAKVRQQNNAGFVQMATNLALDPSSSATVDATGFDGIEVDLFYGEGDDEVASFNLHVKNVACIRQFWSYRTTFQIPKGEWTSIRLPFSDFNGHGDGIVDTEFDTSSLRRLGVVAIGNNMEATLALSSIGFYND